MVQKKCLNCKKIFQVSNYRGKIAKYCSAKCRMDNWVVPVNAIKIKKGQHLSPKTQFKKGMKVPKGKNNLSWKGEKASYSGVHRWVNRNWVKHKKCDHCKKIRKIHWANKDHKYKRIRIDWMCLCASCHPKYDFKMGLRKLSPNSRRNLKYS